MIYHDLDELNLVIQQLNNYCTTNGFNINIIPNNNYFNYRITDELSDDFTTASGLIYKLFKHNNKQLTFIDTEIIKSARIELNYIKDKNYKYGDVLTRNEYICLNCKQNNNIYVCKTFDFIDTFCLHTDYIKDEIMCLIDE